jgi:hypothetical protein
LVRRDPARPSPVWCGPSPAPGPLAPAPGPQPTLRLPVSHKVARFLRVFGQPYATAATLDAHRGRPDYLESVNCRWLVVKVGAPALPRVIRERVTPYGASLACITVSFRGKWGQTRSVRRNSLRNAWVLRAVGHSSPRHQHPSPRHQHPSLHHSRCSSCGVTFKVPNLPTQTHRQSDTHCRVTKCICGGEMIAWGTYPRGTPVPHICISRNCRRARGVRDGGRRIRADTWGWAAGFGRPLAVEARGTPAARCMEGRLSHSEPAKP